MRSMQMRPMRQMGSMIVLQPEYRGYGLTAREALPGGLDLAIGGGTAMGGALIARGVAPAGSWWARHAGLVGGLGGMAVALAARQPYTGVLAAALVGGTVELVQLVTSYRVTSAGG